jgi:hypothetical protein
MGLDAVGQSYPQRPWHVHKLLKKQLFFMAEKKFLGGCKNILH